MADAFRPSSDEALRVLESIRRGVRVKRCLQHLVCVLSGFVAGLGLGLWIVR